LTQLRGFTVDLLTRRLLGLVINQAIHTPHTDLDPTHQTHALNVIDPDDPLQTLILPLTLRGVTSLLHMRNVTVDDFIMTIFLG
jgi:hypothetical protein